MSTHVVPLLTPWSYANAFDPCAAYEIAPEVAIVCDQLYRQMVIEIVQRVMPWLPDALAAAGALVVGAGPGSFEFVLPDGQRHQVAEIAALLKMVPWRVPGEPCH